LPGCPAHQQLAGLIPTTVAVAAGAELAADGPVGLKGRSDQDRIGLEPRSSQTQPPMPPGHAQPQSPRAAELAVCDETIEERFQAAKDQVGLDHYQVCKSPGWYRHITLALLAHAFLVITRTKATTGDRAKGDAAA
jgi:hypothetical protein